MWRQRLAVAVLFALLPAASVAADGFGSVTVRESAGVGRRHWPLRFGYPFPAGRLNDPAKLTVVDGGGRKLPTQTRALAEWPDGSVRWLLVDTQSDLSADSVNHFTLQSVPAPPPSAALRVRETSAKIEIDSGLLRFEVPRNTFAVLDAMRLPDGTVAGGPMTSSLRAGGTQLRAKRPDSVTVREDGPLRVQVEIRGSYGNGFDYLVRVEAYAGQPFVRLFHTVINRAQRAYVDVDRIALEWPLPDRSLRKYSFGVEGERKRAGQLAKSGLRLFQGDNQRYAVDARSQMGRLSGWLALRGKSLGVGIAARWFWQEYPKAIEARPGSLIYELWASEAGATRFGMGAAKTHELVVWAAKSADFEPNLAAAAARPVVAAVDADWIYRSGAFPQAIPATGQAQDFTARVVAAAGRVRRRNAVERWDDRGEVRCDGNATERPRVGAYGMWNWGDWNFPKYHDSIKGCDAWGNLEYDTSQVQALGFAASGDVDLHDDMVAAARHFMDVDTIHFFPSQPEWVGMNHPKNPLHFSFELGGVDLGHTWTEGLLSYYFLTGDDRGLDAARGIADYLVRRVRGFVRGNPRQWGWPQIALVAVYDATGEKKYLDAARQYATGGMAAHEPVDTEKWKLGILADGLAYTHAVTADPKIMEWLLRYAAAVAGRRVKLDARLFPAVAYVAATRGDAALAAAAAGRVAGLDLGSWGKPFTINGRIGFRIYSLLGPAVAGKRPGASGLSRGSD